MNDTQRLIRRAMALVLAGVFTATFLILVALEAVLLSFAALAASLVFLSADTALDHDGINRWLWRKVGAVGND